MKTSVQSVHPSCELPRCFKLPASVPRRFRVQDQLGFDSFSARIAFGSWEKVHDFHLDRLCIWQQQRGPVTISASETTLLLPGECAILLPDQYELSFVDPDSEAVVSILADEAIRRLLRLYPAAHGLMRYFPPSASRIFRLPMSGLSEKVTPDHTRGLLRGLLTAPVSIPLVQALASGPCTDMALEEPVRRRTSEGLRKLEFKPPRRGKRRRLE